MYISDEKLLAFRIKKLRIDKEKEEKEIASLLNIRLKRYKSLENGYAKLKKEEETAFKIYYGLEDNYFKKEASLQEELDIKHFRTKTNNIVWAALLISIGSLVCFFVLHLIFAIRNDDIYEEFRIDDFEYQVLENDLFGSGKVSCVKYYGNEEEVHIPEEIYARFGKKYEVVSVDLLKFDNVVYLPKSIISFKGYLNGPIVRRRDGTMDGNAIIDDFPCKGIIVAEDNPMFDSRDNCNCIIEKKTNKLLFSCKENSFIPDTVTSIGSRAFFYRDIDKLVIPGNVKRIERQAFDRCRINYLILEEGVEILEQTSFYTSHVYNVVLPQTLKTLDNDMFSGSQTWFYTGTRRSGVAKGLLNLYLYSSENPTVSGNYWHYVNGIPTPWYA